MGRKEHPARPRDQRKKRKRTNVLPSLELFSGECFFATSASTRPEEVAAYMDDMAAFFGAKGYNRLVVFLDRNTAHQKKVAGLLEKALGERKAVTEVEFHHFPAYSPKLNVFEYAIHLIRLKVLNHADAQKDLRQFVGEIKVTCRKLLSTKQIVNILEHFEGLVKSNNLSPERE